MAQLPAKTNSLLDDGLRPQFNDARAYGLAKPSDISRPSSTAPRTTEAYRSNVDTLSDKATAAFIRRTLCAHHALSGTGDKGRATPRPVDELLPPLTSSNAVDLQLYAIIAVILKEFVYTWYGKITPDHVFVHEVIQIIAHCTRALEQRLRKVDLNSLLLDELPLLIDAHLAAFRVAHESIYPQPLASSPRQIYHTLIPHPALSPVPLEADSSTLLEQERNEEAWRQLLVQGVLAVLLPTEDLENACLRALVSEILAEMILGNGLSKKACEPWLLWDAISTVIEATQARSGHEVIENQHSPTTATTRLEESGLLSKPDQRNPESRPFSQKRQGSATSSHAIRLFWMAMQYIFLASTAIRAIILAFAASSTLPFVAKERLSPTETERQETKAAPYSQRPILMMRVWSMTGHLIELKTRMPWLSGLLGLVQYAALYGPGEVGATDGALDRLLSNYLQENILNPADHIPKIIRLLRATLFPNNAPAPSRPIPSAVEIVAIKRKCAESVARILPPALAARFFGLDGRGVDGGRKDGGEGGDGDGVVVDEVERLLDFLGDSYMNRHLVFGIVELVVVRVLPELGEKSVGELMRERLGEV